MLCRLAKSRRRFANDAHNRAQQQNAERIRKVIFGMIAKIPPNFESPIRHALDYAKVTV